MWLHTYSTVCNMNFLSLPFRLRILDRIGVFPAITPLVNWICISKVVKKILGNFIWFKSGSNFESKKFPWNLGCYPVVHFIKRISLLYPTSDNGKSLVHTSPFNSCSNYHHFPDQLHASPSSELILQLPLPIETMGNFWHTPFFVRRILDGMRW